MTRLGIAIAVVGLCVCVGCKRDAAPVTRVDAGATPPAGAVVTSARTGPTPEGADAGTTGAPSAEMAAGTHGNQDAGAAGLAQTGADTGPGSDAGTIAALPPPRFPEVPGWLGFATRPEGEAKVWWSPAHPRAEVVAFAGLDTLPPGTKLIAIDSRGTVVEVTSLGTSEHRYGCEQNTAAMSGFDAPASLAEGPVWLMPAGTPGVSGAAVEGSAPKKGAQARTWKVGELELAARTTAKAKGKLEVREAGKVSASLDFEKGYMEGSDEGPYDLSDDNEVGLTVPMGAYRLGQGGPLVVVLKRSGYEGITFQLVVKPEGGQAFVPEESEGLYYCAF